MNEQAITRFLHSRYALFAMMVIAAIASYAALAVGDINPFHGNDGFGFPSANKWITSPGLSCFVNFVLNLGITVLMVVSIREFNMFRSTSVLFASMFLVIQAACPSVIGQLYDGTVLCLLVLLAIFPLYISYQKPHYTRSIFLVFFLMALGSLSDYSYVAYALAFFIGCWQMQCISLRVLITMVLGLITPLWITLGLGITHISSFRGPQLVNVFTALATNEMVQFIAYTAVTLLLGVSTGGFNMVRIYRSNARMRAYNGFWLVLSLITVMLMLVDYYHLFIYVPMLNCCAAMQVGHFFIFNSQKRSYVAIMLIVAIYAGLAMWGYAV